MWTIGIIEDKESERNDIQVSIWEGADNKERISFKIYELADKESLLAEVMDDITDDRIHTLLVDYKIDIEKLVIDGGEIVKYLHDRVPDFPVIIMTNVLESKESPYIDSDKVYPKIKFFNTETEDSREMVQNILRNIRRYEGRRKELEGQLDLQLERFRKDSSNGEIVENILKIENELSKFKEMNQTTIDQAFDMQELKEVIRELQDIDKLLIQ